MADLSLSAVTATAQTTAHSGVAGEAITAGEAVYIDSNDGRVWLAQAAGTKAQAECVGLAANAAAAGNPVDYFSGVVDVTGATEGLAYFLSATAGDLSPHTDPTTPDSTEYATVVAVAETATRLHVKPVSSGGQVA